MNKGQLRSYRKLEKQKREERYRKAIESNQALNYSEQDSASLAFGSSKKHYSFSRSAPIKTPEQDELARRRREQIAAEHSKAFPKATINQNSVAVGPLGDSDHMQSGLSQENSNL